MQLGILYAVWSGLGSVTLLTIDWLVFKERMRWTHPLGMTVILVGVVLLGGERHT
jgi:quaternary ammonium compound-resistance protein SugE